MPEEQHPSKFQTIKAAWLRYVHRQTEKTSRDPMARAKVMGWVVTLLIISFGLPKGGTSFIACSPCVTWAAKFCGGLIAAGGACASVAAFPPLLCACLLSAGGIMCAGAAVTCTAVCLYPSP